jgi:hypothetical protein
VLTLVSVALPLVSIFIVIGARTPRTPIAATHTRRCHAHTHRCTEPQCVLQPSADRTSPRVPRCRHRCGARQDCG